jgi:acetylornithine/succinyldiaminopimelate/putrescine aminotransferase
MTGIPPTDPRPREAATTLPVYGQLPFVPESATGCDIVTTDGRRILDLYGGHAVAALGYGHPALVFVNSGAEANENALRMACVATGRKKVLAITHGFHGRTAAAGAVTWNSEKWYGFPKQPVDVEFIPRDDCDAAREMIGPDVAAVIFEPVQGIAGAYDLSPGFLTALRDCTAQHGAVLIADEVQSGMGRSGHYFAVQAHGITPDILTTAKALGGGIPCGAVLCNESIAAHFGPGALGTTFGGGPVAAAAINAVIDTIENDQLLSNVREREAQIREQCVTGPVKQIQGMGLLLGLVCDRPAAEVRDALLENDVLTGTSSDPDVLRILAPLVLESEHVDRLAQTLESITTSNH